MPDAVNPEQTGTAAAFGRFREVHKVFPRLGQAPLVAIRSVSFDLEAGKFVTLLGPSGCGKTTFLRIVAGLIPSTSGVSSRSATSAFW